MKRFGVSKKCSAGLAVFLLCVLLFSPDNARAVACQEPMYGRAVVDGDYSEWNLNSDFFANLYHAWDKPTILAKLYLRYDCAEDKMYALVLTTQMDRVLEAYSPVESWIKIDGEFVVNGTYDSFEWIDKVGDYAVGWEASFDLAVGDYGIQAHSNVYWDGGSQTAGTSLTEIDMCIDCPVLGRIGDYVWHDVNENGLQDDGPMSVVGIPNITVRLMQCDGTGSVVAEYTTQTDANGWYLFADLEAACYFVDVDERDEDMPTDAAGRTWVQTTLTTENKHDPHQVPLAHGQVYLDADFGFAGLINPDLGTIGDYTWWDEDDNNEQWHDPNIPDLELPYIIVELYKSGVLMARAKTDRFGNYLFYNVPFADDYVVVVDESGPAKPYLVESLRSTVPYGEIGALPKSSAVDRLFKTTAAEDVPYWELYNWQFTGTPPYGNNHSVAINDLAPDYLDADFPYLEQDPIDIGLLLFRATFKADGVHLDWETAQEENVAGYHLLRKESANDSFDRVNEQLIPARGTAANGAAYEFVDDVDHAATYYYKVLQLGLDGRLEESEPICVALSTDVFAAIYGPSEFALYDNYPNPFNPTTVIQFDVPEDELVTLEIYDVRGVLVRRLLHDQKSKGTYTAVWDGRNDVGMSVAAGLFFYRMTAGDFSATGKMTFLK